MVVVLIDTKDQREMVAASPVMVEEAGTSFQCDPLQEKSSNGYMTPQDICKHKNW